ncbi:DUF4142 domain-containing protein [Allosphingosinicella indica]|uniref:DUF4142 domain-containing protein n=1 Tax=Allosphingosinicella indica TaxID=941907 RepID=UPI003CC7C5B7
MRPPVDLAARMDAKQRGNFVAPRKANGAGFDNAYLRQQVPAHQEALARVEPYAKARVGSHIAHAPSAAGPIRPHERARDISRKR